MKVKYKGYEISVSREKCLAGYKLLYYSIFRVSDGFECVSDYTDSSETIRETISYLKERVDEEEKTDDPWDEKEYLN